MLQHTNVKQNRRLREDVIVMFQSAPSVKKRKVAHDDKDCEVVGFIDLQHHDMNGQTTDITQWMMHGNKHANCWGYGSLQPFQ